VRFLLDTLSPLLVRPLTPDDVIGGFAGLRPLVAGTDPARRTADLSRRHLVHRSADGVITVVGGKLTTYRRMAEDTVDAAELTEAPSRTRGVRLVGAGARDRLAALDAPQRLVRRYGTEAPALVALAAADPSLAQPVAGGVLGAELAWGVLAEGALTVEDLLERRTRLSFVPDEAEQARAAAERILERYSSPVRTAVALG
jgi:glycerol-3-phosphate dehydrogenase